MNLLIFLQNQGILDGDQIKVVESVCQKTGRAPEDILHELGFVQGNVLQQLSNKDTIDLEKTAIDLLTVSTISAEYLQQHALLPFSTTEDRVLVAAAREPEVYVKDFIQRSFKKRVEIFLAPKHQVLESIAQYTQDKQKWEDLLDGETFATKMVQRLVSHCVLEKVSDVHIEPQELFVRIRVRKDGVLQQLCVFAKEYWPSLCVKIKLLANMDISQTLMPQDGRFDFYALGRSVDLRVSTRPVVYGENIVIRVLDAKSTPPDLEHLGYNAETLEEISKVLVKSNGIFIVTGPTGSGKSTLLFAMLSKLSSNAVSIATIEDPVEYRHPNFRQTDISVYKKMSFATTVKAILRQDPDIISISEIRDDETAAMAVRAAMTGRMLLTTLHTADIFGVFDRLEDLGISKRLLVPHLSGIATQRLVRKLCKECRGIKCKDCGFTGYKGRFAVCKVMYIDEQIQEILLNNSIQQAKKIIEAKGSFKDELLKQVELGNTDLTEVQRVYGEIY